MSINLFFAIVMVALLAMFGFFKPSYTQTISTQEIPKVELESFVVYEVGVHGVERFFEGKEGKRFEDRYEVSSAKFSNNSKQLLESIRADEARYKDDFITLSGNVHYVREDGLEFRSSEGTYDQNNSLIQTQGNFVITQNHNRLDGTKLHYNTEHNTVLANTVRGSYQLD